MDNYLKIDWILFREAISQAEIKFITTGAHRLHTECTISAQSDSTTVQLHELPNSAFWGQLSMESRPQNPEFRNNSNTFQTHELYHILLPGHSQMSHDTWFPTMWHFDKCILRQACAASFKALQLQMMFGQ